MESIIWFENMLSSSSADLNDLPLTEEIIFEDSFANEIYMKYIDEESSSDHIKLADDDFHYDADKVDFSVINHLVTPIKVDDEKDQKAGITYLASNDQLIMDFNSLLDSVQMSEELTPPQTPPPEIFRLPSPIYQQQNIPNGFEIYEFPCEKEHFNNFSQSSSPSLSFYEGSNQSDDVAFDPDSIISSSADIQRELEVVDELVRAHSRHASDVDDSKSSILSVSSVWSPRSDYASSSCSQFDYYEQSFTKKSSGLSGVTKKRPRAYRRNPEEKKYRKKEQNKNAATRYRQKKKQEIEIIMDEGKILEDKHKKLMVIYKDAKREVKCLKGLLRDLFTARGFI